MYPRHKEKKMGTINDTLTDVGVGTGNVLTEITPGLVLIVAALGIVGAIVYMIRNIVGNVGR